LLIWAAAAAAVALQCSSGVKLVAKSNKMLELFSSPHNSGARFKRNDSPPPDFQDN